MLPLAPQFGVGMMSGVLLRDYCPPVRCTTSRSCLAPRPHALQTQPDQGPCHGRMLWFLIGCTTFSSPVLIWLFRRVIQPGSTSTPMRSAEGQCAACCMSNAPHSPTTPARVCAEEGDREVLTEGVGNLDTQDAYAHLEEASPVEMATCASPGSPCSLSSVDSSSSTRSVGQR